ncbi:flavodoxin [Paucidesulfovibrio longus]|uniref:flavodoxin n=1 Tax=Paucidesulfovibrio longus TaxID=889 RepID=UPI0003B6B666|nr:flavodoxin [Paucidesulfovibrio longus]
MKTRVVYGSSTGNTETVAHWIAGVLRKGGADTEVLDAAKTRPEGLAEGVDLLLLGSSTWGEDEIELQDDFVPLFERLELAGLRGARVAVFGCGSSEYAFFCGAVDAIESRVGELGARLVHESLRVDGDPVQGEVEAWAEALLGAFQEDC